MLVESMSSTIAYKSGYKYQLAEDAYFLIPELAMYNGQHTAYISIDDEGRVFIKSGYAWDGASGPTWDSKDTMKTSLIHDVLYQLMRHDIIPHTFRETADDILKEVGLEDGMNSARVWVWHFGLSNFGSKNVLASRRKQKEFAP